MNEHGLSVTTTAGGIPVGMEAGLRPPQQDGFQFWALVRTILESCRTVAEAVALFEEFPLCGNPILLFADSSGTAVIAEALGAHKSTRRIDAGSGVGYLAATNHYTTPELQRCDPTALDHSRRRYAALTGSIAAQAPEVTVEGLKALLATPYPQGPCCHYYQEFFGTLHALVFDLDTCRAEVAFGSPLANRWYSFELNETSQAGNFPVILPQEHTLPELWAMEA